MEISKKRNLFLILTICLFVLFFVFTILVKKIDVATYQLGNVTKEIGFSHINIKFRDLVGTNMTLYKVTDYASLIVIIPGVTYLVIGIYQWVKRKHILKVDANILALGIFYVCTGLTYLLFELIKINYRPVLIDGKVEASYPSSTTVLALCFLVSSIDQTNRYIKNKPLQITLMVLSIVLSIFFVVGRTISGVHWLTDILGGILVSAFLLCLYYFLMNWFSQLQNKNKPEVVQ